MTLRIDFQSRKFPSVYSFRSGTLEISWDELLWAAITIGRPSTYHVFQHGPASFHEAIFRLSLIRLSLQQGGSGRLQRTDAFAALDPTEKGMVSYFLGMTLCKLFASRLLATPWLLHLDVFRSRLNPVTLGRSRPDLVGKDSGGAWHAFESKGRTSVPSSDDRTKAKVQAQRLVSVDGQACSLHVGSLAFFRSDELEFYWRDPRPDTEGPIKLPQPGVEWRYYYEPALSLASMDGDTTLASDRENADVSVTIHPKIRPLLDASRWSEAHEVAGRLGADFKSHGYQPDGLKVAAGASWSRPLEDIVR
jgi:hypothetical protein